MLISKKDKTDAVEFLGNGDDNNQFMHCCKQKDIENFYKIMLGEKKIISKRDEEEFEGGYFAMCLFLTKETFLGRFIKEIRIKKMKL